MAIQGGVAGARGPGAAVAKPGVMQAFEALKYGTYRTLWVSQLFSFMGMQMQQVARGVLAFELTGSYTAVGVVMMAWGLPQLVFSLVGGAVADRVNKRNVILISQTGTGVLSLLNAVLITTGYISIPWLFALGIVQGTLFAFNMPARQAFVAELVPQKSLLNAIALNNVGMNATRIVGPAAAGLMIKYWGIDIAYYTQAAMLLVVVGLTLMLPNSTAHLTGAAQRKGIFHEIGLGLKFIGSSRTLVLLMVMAFVPTLIGMPYVTLLPGFAAAELGLQPDELGFMFTMTGAGAIVGSIAVAAMTDFSRKPLAQAVMGLGYGLSLAGLGAGALFAGYTGSLVALVLLGLFSTTFQTLNNTMIMSETRPEFYGRVMSVYMLTFSLFPLMSGPAGVVADAITATTTFMGMGAAITAFVLGTMLLSPRYTFSKTVKGAAAGGPAPVGAGAAPAAPVHAASAAVSPSMRGIRPVAPVATSSLLAVAAGDEGGVSRAAVARRPARRDYLAGPSAEEPRARDYMAPSDEAALDASLESAPEPGEERSAEPIAFPGAGAYGLVTKRAPSAPAASSRRRDYGFEPATATLRAVGAAHPIEAGDATNGPIEAGDGAGLASPFVFAAVPVGRFQPAPIEVVTAPALRARRPEDARPMLIATLTATICTSVLALFVGRRSPRR
ncbi:MAG: MFS transporter [Dehalococcoidia bacterium]